MNLVIPLSILLRITLKNYTKNEKKALEVMYSAALMGTEIF